MRAIIPIYIELLDKLIETQSDLQSFLNSSDEIAKNLSILSGDIETLFYGYAEDELASKYRGIQKELLEDVNFHTNNNIMSLYDFIDTKRGNFTAYAGKYNIKDSIFKNSLSLNGYHRQKTIVLFDVSTDVFSENLNFKYLTIGKKNRGCSSNIYVKSGSILSLQSCIVDAISIVVEDGGVLVLDDVDFKGGVEAVIQQGTGIVLKSGEVRFDGVAFEYYFENLTSDTAKNIIEIKNPKSIREFLSKSKADKIFLESDLDFSEGGNIAFNNDVSFLINEEKYKEEYVKVIFKEAAANKNLSFSKRCYVDGEIKGTDSNNNIIQLGNFIGTVDFENSQTQLENTVFMPKEHHFSIKSEYSKLYFKNCLFIGDNAKTITPIKTSFSELHFEKVKFKKCDNFIDVSKHIRQTDESSFEFEHEISTISFNELVIEDANSFISNDGQLSVVKGSKLKLLNVKHGIVLHNCNFFVDVLQLHNSDTINISGKSAARISGENSIIANTRMPLTVSEGSFVDLYDITFESNQDMASVSLENSIVICNNVKFRNNNTAIHIKKGGLLVNNGIKFNENLSNIKKDHEAFNVMDYKEWLIEKEKMQPSQD